MLRYRLFRQASGDNGGDSFFGVMIEFDESGSIGKRYRRQDEIGTPVCFTYDFDSETDNSVTVRDRDTTKQERIGIDKATEYLMKLLQR